MRLTTLLLTVTLLEVSAHGVSQQVTYSASNVKLEKVFSAIEKQTGFVFFYKKQDIAGSNSVTIDFKNVPIEKALEETLKGQELTFSIEGNTIVISRKPTQAVDLQSTATLSPPLIDIQGRVTDSLGNPLVGASVTVKGTRKGTTTDANGNFSLSGLKDNATILISFTGYETRQIALASNPGLKSGVNISGNPFSLTLKRSISPLDQVQVIAYGTTTQRLSTGDITTISAKEIGEQPVSNPLAALEGKVPGLYIQQNTGVPGGAFTVLLRGQNSIAQGNSPFYIIDGVPFNSAPMGSSEINSPTLGGSPLNSLNPADIESIDILKDADATAIYGSRGANGVILITTKKGKSGSTKINVNVNNGIGRVTRMMDLLNTKQYLEVRNQAFTNDNATPQPYDYDVNGTWDTTRYTNWQKNLIGGTAHLTDAVASMSGGNALTQFYLSTGYHRESTVFPGNFSDQKGSMHFNLSHTTADQKFSAIFSSSYIIDNNNLSQDQTSNAVMLPPDAPRGYDSSGKINWQGYTWQNPYSVLLQKYSTNTNNLVSNLLLNYQIIPNLNVKASVGYNNIMMKEIQEFPLSSFSPVSGIQSSAYFSNNSIQSWIVEPQLEYLVNIGEGKLNALVGATFQQSIQENQTITGSGFISDALIDNIQAAANISVLNYNYSNYKYNAFFGRLNYNWKNKYMINLTARRDGSSRFGPGNQFANFGAVGAAWIFTKEKFTQENLAFLSFGKLRASYGITGNDQIANYGYLDLWNPTTRVYQGAGGLYPLRLNNPDYAWETNKKAEIGLDFGFINDRILVSFSYFKNRSSNELVGYTLPSITGFNSVQSNLPAVVQNSGYEIVLNTINIKSSKFYWNTSINLTIPRNVLASYPDLKNSSYSYTYVVGQPLSVVQAFHNTGVDPQLGIYQFQKVGQNVSTVDPLYPQDLQALKSVTQNYFGGIQNDFRFGKFELNFLLQFVKQTGIDYFQGVFDAPGTAGNQPNLVLSRWHKQGDNTSIQKYTQDFGSVAYNSFINNKFYGDFAISDASFIRLKTAYLSYLLYNSSTKGGNSHSIRMYIEGQNLLTITKYLGFDPENQSTSSLPTLRVITLGVQLNF